MGIEYILILLTSLLTEHRGYDFPLHVSIGLVKKCIRSEYFRNDCLTQQIENFIIVSYDTKYIPFILLRLILHSAFTVIMNLIL